MLVLAGVTIGFSVLYGLAWKATIKCRRWAPITVTILLSLGLCVSLFGTVAGAVASTGMNARSSSAVPSALVGVISLVIGGVLVLVAARAIVAIPKYLATPAWCQELLAKRTT